MIANRKVSCPGFGESVCHAAWTNHRLCENGSAGSISTVVGGRAVVSLASKAGSGVAASASNSRKRKLESGGSGSTVAPSHVSSSSSSSSAFKIKSELEFGEISEHVAATAVPVAVSGRYISIGTVRTLTGHSGGVWALAVLADGRVCSGSGDNTVKVWDVSSGVCERTLTDHSDRVSALAVLADGRVCSGSFDNTVKVWDVSSVGCVKRRV